MGTPYVFAVHIELKLALYVNTPPTRIDSGVGSMMSPTSVQYEDAPVGDDDNSTIATHMEVDSVVATSVHQSQSVRTLRRCPLDSMELQVCSLTKTACRTK